MTDTEIRIMEFTATDADLMLDWLECIIVGGLTERAEFVLDHTMDYDNHLRNLALDLRARIHKMAMP